MNYNLLAPVYDLRVTVLDQSPKMLKICRRRLNAAGLEAVVVEAELFSFMQKRAALGDAANFDVVVAPYFLNVFSAAQLPVALQALVHLLRPGGRMISVDFRAPSSSRVFSWLQRLYYFPPLLLFYTLAHNPWHELYDYRRVVEDSRLPLRLTTNLVHPAWGFPLLETLIWTKL
jgi:SAM-dependent methyltransferase